VVEYGSSDYSVAVLPHFQHHPKVYRDAAIPIFLSVGYDGGGNLFLLGTNASRRTSLLAELPRGRDSFRAISLKLPSGRVRTVAWDGAELTLEGNYQALRAKSWPQVVYQLRISGTKAAIVKTIDFDGVDRSNKPPASTIAPALGIMAVPAGDIRIWGYPSGGKMIATFHTGVGPTYTATVAARSSQ
jgi:hypothetical protein